MISQLLLGLSILVILHEAGHFFAARMFGIKVEKFYLFFDAWNISLLKFKKGDTEYGIGWLPLGGYVKIAGMIDESLDKDQLDTPIEPHEFRSKPAWQRLIVMVGGVIVNALLGIIIFSGVLFYFGEKYIPMTSLKHGIVASQLAHEVGINTGDKIIAINDRPAERFNDIYSSDLLLTQNSTVTLSRNDSVFKITLPSDFASTFIDAEKTSFLLPRTTFSVAEVIKGNPGYEAGLRSGDSIVGINEIPIRYYDEAQLALKSFAGKQINLTVMRENAPVVLKPVISEDGTLGFYPKAEEFNFRFTEFSLLSAIPAGYNMAYKTLSDNVKGFGKMFSGDIPVSKSLGGPIAIAKKMYGGIWDWYRFWVTTALLSIVLAFMNLLPIPALDGGHVVFLIIEMITGKPVGEKTLMVAQYFGMILLLSLMVFVFGNDIWQHLIK